MKLPRIGDIVASKYRLDRVIGRGGFATVYEAIDPHIQRHVALKVLTPGAEGYPLSVASRFAREAKALAQLNDRHTIRMFDYGRTDEGVLFMVFELIGGVDLSAHLAAVGTMSEADTIHVLKQLLRSLDEAHRVQILHRDIKPGNIRIYEYMGDPLCVKLMDFGIARSMGPDNESITATGRVIGTVRYMSPEQVTGAELTASSDLFTLGAVAFEMLTADRRPAVQMIDDRALKIPVSAPFADVLQRMLSRDPADRYPSASAVLEALGALAAAPPRPMPPVATVPEDVLDTLEDTADKVVAPKAPPHRPPDRAQTPEPTPLPRLALLAVALITCIALALAIIATRLQPVPVTTGTSVRPPSRFVVAPRATPAVPADVPLAAASPAAAPADGCGVRSDVVGDHRRFSVLMGLSREKWVTYIPAGYDPQHRYPVLVLFHADGSTATEAMRHADLRIFADRHQFLIVAPNRSEIAAFGRGVDTRFVRRVLDNTAATYCVDARRIFAFGVGSGGGGVDAISCSPWLVAAATASFRYNAARFLCSPARPLPYLHFAPLLSQHLPIEGGPTCGNYEQIISLEAHDQLWRDRNRCAGVRTERGREGESICYTWDCEQPYVSCHIQGGHSWKGHPRAIDVLNCDGPESDFPHLETMWAFFTAAAEASTATADTPHPGDQ